MLQTRRPATETASFGGFRRCLAMAWGLLLRTRMRRSRVRAFRASAICIVGAFTPGCVQEDAAATCPEQQPEEGSACVGTLMCVYQRCDDGRPIVEAICERDEFRIRHSSCNPPWDGGPGRDAAVDAGDARVATCPAQPPALGAPCSDGLACVYERCLAGGGHPTLEAVCQDGAVEILRTSCNPPPPSLDASSLRDASAVDATADATTDAVRPLDGE